MQQMHALALVLHGIRERGEIWKTATHTHAKFVGVSHSSHVSV